MSQNKAYLAVDLGAGSGRVLAGIFDGHRIELHELNRFENIPVELPSGHHWNITALYQNILDGLKCAAESYGSSVVSLGIDTWGVDYGLIDESGRLLGLPYQYRDNRTEGMMDVAYSRFGKEKIYQGTGIQVMFFNTLFQLTAEVESNSAALKSAEDLLFTPDLLGYWLTGEKAQERSIASTSQLYNPLTRDWNYELIESIGIPARLFKSLSDPGTELGPLSDAVAKEANLDNVKVITVAGHDTASAVAAVPSQLESPAYLSSGTWSLMGLELAEPVINDRSFQDSFTNEIGIGHTTRYLKNISGLWLIQESRRQWKTEGVEIPYGKMASMAQEVEAFRSLINPDDPAFASQGNMPDRIQKYCEKTGQPVPQSKGEVIRCIYESLALRYAEVWNKLLSYVSEKPTVLHIVGGGCQDALLNQMTANAIQTRVLAGPVEATGLGNILAQLLADGSIQTLAEGRKIVEASSTYETYEPQDSVIWQAASEKFQKYSKVNL